MTIKVKFLFFTFATVLLVATVGLMIYQVTQRIAKEIEETNITQKIVQIATSRHGLMFDYYRFHEDRPKAQWQLLENEMNKLTQSGIFDTTAEQSVLKQINETSEQVNLIFAEIVANHEKLKSGYVKPAFAEELEQELISRLLTETQINITRAYTLSNASLADIKTAQNILIFTTTISLIIVLFFLAMMFLLFNRYITRPLKEINEGAEIIGDGNLDYRIDIKSNNEIGQIAKAFNIMASKLKALYAGLEEKIKEKTKSLTREKSKVESLAKDLEKFKLAVDNASDQVIITDQEATVLYANNAAEKITGYSIKEIIGQKAGKLWGNLMARSFYENLWQTIKIDKKTFTGEIINKRKNNETYTAVINISPILDKNKNIIFFVGIERDITHEKEIDKAKTEFVSIASHQLRTPLSAIGWYAEMLLSGDAGNITDDQKKYLNEIYTANNRMVKLVNTLLSVSRLELGTFVIEPVPTDVIKLARSVLDEQKLQISKKKLKVKFAFAEDVPVIQADPKLLGLVFQNLLSNAVKYTPEDGNIEFTISADTKNISIKIFNNGLGIPKSQQNKVFTKFFQADNIREQNIEGTGLGLYIVKSIIDRSSGKIRFESEENKSTTFYVTIPLEGMKKKEGTKTLSPN